MYKVNLAFIEELVSIIIVDEERTPIFKTYTLLGPLFTLCSLGTDYAVEASVPALPATLTMKVNTDQVMITNPIDPDQPIVLVRAELVAALMKGFTHGKAKQVVERPDTHPRSTEGRDLGVDSGVYVNRYRDVITDASGASGADGQSGPSEAAPL